MRVLLLLPFLGLMACVPTATTQPAAQVQFFGGSGEDVANAVSIRGIKGEMGGENVAGNAAIKAAKADWLAENYPGWAIVSELGGVDGTTVYNAVTIRKDATTKKVYFDVSEYAWSVMLR